MGVPGRAGDALHEGWPATGLLSECPGVPGSNGGTAPDGRC